MTYVISIDDRGGMAFMGKRLSRDRVQMERLRALVGTRPLYVTPYTARLVEGWEGVCVTEDVTVRRAEAVMLLETVDPAPLLRAGDVLVVYGFGRHYPSDLACTVDLASLTKESECTFVGSSHPEMTETLYRVP